MLRNIACLFLSVLFAPAVAGETDDLVDRLFDQDPAVRAAAREQLAQAGEGTLAKVLDRIEARQAPRDVLHLYAVADLQQDKSAWKLALARVRTAAGESGDVVVKEHDGTLIVRAPQEAQARIAAELDALRSALSQMVTMEVRLVRFDKAPGVSRVPVARIEGFLNEHGAKVVTAPRLTCRNGQRANIRVVDQVSYVSDFDLEVAERGVIADPVVAIAHDGVSADLRPVVVEGGGAVLVAVEVTRAELEAPLPTMPLPIHGVPGATIQVPVGKTRTLVKLVRCSPDVAVIIDCGDNEALIVSAQPFRLAEAASIVERNPTPKAKPKDQDKEK